MFPSPSLKIFFFYACLLAYLGVSSLTRGVQLCWENLGQVWKRKENLREKPGKLVAGNPKENVGIPRKTWENQEIIRKTLQTVGQDYFVGWPFGLTIHQMFTAVLGKNTL